MGNQTIPLQNSTATRTAKQAKGGKPKAKRPSGWQLLLYFAQRHPFICLFVVWGSFLFFGWLAITGLTYTNPAPLEVVESPQPVAESPEATPAESNQHGNALGLLAVVVATCATSSILLSRRLHPVQPTPRRIITRQAVPESVRTVRTSQQLSRSHPSTGQPTTRTKPINAPRPEAIAPRTSARSPVVTVLTDDKPPETRKPSLAEMLDVRRQERPSKPS